jgi:transposase, IS6 family
MRRPTRIDVLASKKRHLAVTRRSFTASQARSSTDRSEHRSGAANPRTMDKLLPDACHVMDQYANNAVNADHGS